MSTTASALEAVLLWFACRRRFLRNARGQQQQQQRLEDELLFGGAGNNAVRPALLGPPTHIIDLDLPMLEIFWRSLLPWNSIEIVRPRR